MGAPQRLGGRLPRFEAGQGRRYCQCRRSPLGLGATTPRAARSDVLVLSNGHGEDAIACSVVQELMTSPAIRSIKVLPIVGEGKSFRKLGLQNVCERSAVMPSGGFIYRRPLALVRDLKSGLVGLTVDQMRALKAWVDDVVEREEAEAIPVLVAVGDVVPLLFSAIACRRFRKKRKGMEAEVEVEVEESERKEPLVVFVGCAKSQYYLKASRQEKKCVYYRWERWLLSRSCCRLVAPRDKLTAEVLERHLGEKVKYLGNPMMDNIEPSGLIETWRNEEETKKKTRKWVTLLPGTRPGEMMRNAVQILSVCALVGRRCSDTAFAFVLSIPDSSQMEAFDSLVLESGWRRRPSSNLVQREEGEELYLYDRGEGRRSDSILILSDSVYPDAISSCDAAIAMAGTATEQCVGLGNPVVTLIGEGPQFNRSFAEAQVDLLGSDSIRLARTVPEAAEFLEIVLLKDEDASRRAKANGARRMGYPGASRRIADAALELIAAV